MSNIPSTDKIAALEALTYVAKNLQHLATGHLEVAQWRIQQELVKRAGEQFDFVDQELLK